MRRLTLLALLALACTHAGSAQYYVPAKVTYDGTVTETISEPGYGGGPNGQACSAGTAIANAADASLVAFATAPGSACSS